MKKAALLTLFTALVLSSGLALADACTNDLATLDAGLAKKNPDMTEATLNKIRKLRAAGEDMHKAGRHEDAVSTIGKAKELLDASR
jgi:hypothetical protein